jgi:hypothetical protein
VFDQLRSRTVVVASAVLAVALLTVLVVLPFARRWSTREDAISAESERLARLRGLIANQTPLESALRMRAQSSEPAQQLLSGRTSALAASQLQSTLQDFANQSRVTVSRLDVAGAPETRESGVPMIPATLSALGDIYGITELLSRIQNGPLLLEITELTVRPNPALRGELLQMTVALRGAHLGATQ